MAIYSISDLEKLTGIKAHTIRIWEQRYGLVTPARTETNIRYYTDENLRRLFNVALLNKRGIKISHIAKMPALEIDERVNENSENSENSDSQIDALTLAMIDLDEVNFERIFTDSIRNLGFEGAMVHLVYPFLDKLNVLWLSGSMNPVHEKFMTHLFRRKIYSEIDSIQAAPEKNTPLWLLFLPEHETQELTLLFVYHLLRIRRHRVVYLGGDFHINDLSEACHTVRPDYVFTILNETPNRISIQQLVDQMAKSAHNSKLMLSGSQVFSHAILKPENVRFLSGLQETVEFVEKHV